jgi:hypothetical protein
MIRYVDGSPSGTNYDISSRQLTINNAIALKIGSQSASLYFGGLIDEVRVYNRALFAGEVLFLYLYDPSETSTPIFVGLIPEAIINLGILGFLIILVSCAILLLLNKYLGIISAIILIIVGLNYWDYYKAGTNDLLWLAIFSFISAVFCIMQLIWRIRKG